MFVNPFRKQYRYIDENSLVGASIIGRISDWTVIKWRRKRGGVGYPEGRLRASLLPLAVFVPFLEGYDNNVIFLHLSTSRIYTFCLYCSI